jgi:hypothetical protein
MSRDMLTERERRPLRVNTINARPQVIAARLRKMGPALERRFPGCSSFSPVFDADRRPIDFKPNREVRGPTPAVTRRRGKTLAEGLAQQARADARWRRMNQPRTPSGRTIAEHQRELKQRMATWR